MATKIGDEIARRRDLNKEVGAGLQVRKLAEPRYQPFEDFSAGLDVSRAPEAAAANGSPAALDIQVDARNRLLKMPGVAEIEALTYKPAGLFIHPNLDNAADTVFIAPPFYGIRVAGVTSWTAGGLPTGGEWTATLHANNLLLTNNVGDVYVRPLGSTSISPIGWGEAAALQSFGGRVFAGGANIGGQRNPLGIKWTGASGDYRDFNGYGSGYELLLSDTAENDRIVAMRAIGFRLLVVLLRKGVWVGTATGDAIRPADFEPRVVGVGAVTGRAVAATPAGVIFLSDKGVMEFDGSSLQSISTSIDAEILPIDYGTIGRYHAVYNVVKQTYTLFTPAGTFIYDLQRKRWLRSSLRADYGAGLFNPLTVDYGISAGWGLSWGGFWSMAPAGGVSNLFDDELFVYGSLLGRPDAQANANFGVPQDAYWSIPEADLGGMTGLARYSMLDLDYDGQGQLVLQIPDHLGNLRSVLDFGLDSQNARASKRLGMNQTGLGLAGRLQIVSGNPRIWRFGLRFTEAGRRSA